MLLNSREFKFLKNYRNVNVKSSAKREYRDENVFFKGDKALNKLITPQSWIKKKSTISLKVEASKASKFFSNKYIGFTLMLSIVLFKSELVENY